MRWFCALSLLSASCVVTCSAGTDPPEAEETLIALEFDALEVPEDEPFARRFELEEAVFTVGREGQPVEEHSEFRAEGTFDLLFEPAGEGPAQVSVMAFDEVVTGVAFVAGDIPIELPPIELTTDNLDLEQSGGTYDPSTNTVELGLVFVPTSLPEIPGWEESDRGVRFDETMTLDRDTGDWVIMGTSRFTIGGLVFLASTKDKKGKSHPNSSQLAHGLLWAIRAYNQDNIVGILDKAKKCDCTSTCMLAAEQILKGKLGEKLVLDVALSVLEGTFEGAAKGLSGTAKKVLEKALEAVKKVKEKNQVNTTGEKKVDIGTRKGVRIDKECTLKYTLSYDKETRKVIALVECSKCNKDKSCSFLVEYTANKDGLPEGKTSGKVTPLKK